MYYSTIGIIAAIVLLIENQDLIFHYNNGFEKKEWKVYRLFLISVLVYYISDILWGILFNRKLDQLLFVDTSIYFIAMAVSIALWSHYIFTYLNDNNTIEKVFLYCGRVIGIAVSILVFINIFYPVLFSIDTTCVYEPKPFRYVILISQILLLIAISFYALSSIIRQNISVKTRLRFRTLGMFGIIMAVCLILQVYYPLLPIYSIAYMFSTSLIRAFVIGDEKEEYRSGYEYVTKINELRQSISSLLNNMPALTFSKDVETGVYLACNQAFAEYAHRSSPEEVAGLTDFEIFDYDVACHFVEGDKKALEMDKPYVLFEDVTDAAGNPRQFETTKLKFYDTNGRMCLLGMSMDVTDLQKAKKDYQNVASANSVYESIVNALSDNYFNLYYVDIETDDYVEYGIRNEVGQSTIEKRGKKFFDSVRKNVDEFIYEEDREKFIEALDKENLKKEIEKNGSYIIQYRLMIDGKPNYVNLKATSIEGDDKHIVIGINNVDALVRSRAAIIHAQEEKQAYARLSALNSNLIVLYFINPEDGSYTEYGKTEKYKELGIEKQGDDFFASTYKNSFNTVHPDDLKLFQSLITKDNILNTIDKDGIFAFNYRHLNEGLPTYVQLKATKIIENGKPVLILGILDEDAQVKREQEYAYDLSVARKMALVDSLTGVKNKHAYVKWEKDINAKIETGEQEPFAVIVCDINNMKEVNDRYGHKEGDACIRRMCAKICKTYSHSPVFRYGGDEFVVIIQGEDYQNRFELLDVINKLPEDISTIKVGDTFSVGMAEYDKSKHFSLLTVFELADKAMYERKQYMKETILKDSITGGKKYNVE